MKISNLKYIDELLATLSFIGIAISLYLAFLYSVEEVVMGPVQKILYFHVGSAIATYTALFLVFISSICYLSFKDQRLIYLQVSSAKVAFLFSSIVLVTGMIWGHSSWNTWWRWEPRLVSVLVLWLILGAYLYLESNIKFTTEKAKSSILSTLGIISSLQVPIVIFSIKLLDRTQQLHPEVVAKQGLKDSSYVLALVSSNISIMIFSLWLVRIFYLLEKNENLLKIYKKDLFIQSYNTNI